MRPAPFDYLAPQDVEETLAILEELGERAKILAGGQSLVPLMALRLARPEVVVDINTVAELEVMEVDRTVRIGALVRQRRAERSPELHDAAPLLTEALGYVAHPQIRSRGTVGGSLAHADPAAELPSVACALRAELLLATTAGQRTIQASEFFTGTFETELRPEELLLGVSFPRRAPNDGCAFREFSRRFGDFAVVGVAAVVTVNDNQVLSDASVWLSGVDARPVRAAAAEQLVVGEAASSELWLEAGSVAAAGVDPPSDIHGSSFYRRRLAQMLVSEALSTAYQRVTAP